MSKDQKKSRNSYDESLEQAGRDFHSVSETFSVYEVIAIVVVVLCYSGVTIGVIYWAHNDDARHLQLGIVISAAVAAFWFLGYLSDKFLSVPQWIVWVAQAVLAVIAVWGVGSVFITLFDHL